MASLARGKLDQDIDKFFLLKWLSNISRLYWKPAWFGKVYQMNIAIGMADSQVASKKALDVFVVAAAV